MDGGQRRKIEAKRPPYWSSQKAVVTAVISMKVLWDIQEDDPNNKKKHVIKNRCKIMMFIIIKLIKWEFKDKLKLNQITYKIK